MMKESGMPSLRAPEIAYQVEKEYGYSPEEIFSSVFYTNRTETLFNYYRKYMLMPPLQPSDGFYALAELEKRGKLQCSIANNVHNLPGRAGCTKILNLHGTIYDNECPRCGKKYSMEYMLSLIHIFRGAFDVRARDINDEMKMAAAEALANLISEDELSEDYIIPAAFDPRVGKAVAEAVAEAARKSGVARI